MRQLSSAPCAIANLTILLLSFVTDRAEINDFHRTSVRRLHRPLLALPHRSDVWEQLATYLLR